MSGYLRKLFARAGGEPASVAPLLPSPPREHGAGSDLDPFETVAEPATSLTPPAPRQPVLRTERSVPQSPAPPSISSTRPLSPNPGERPVEVVPPVSAPPVPMEAPAVVAPSEVVEPPIAPSEVIPVQPRDLRPESASDISRPQRLEPRQQQFPAAAADLVEAAVFPDELPGIHSEERPAGQPLPESPRQLEPPPIPLRSAQNQEPQQLTPLPPMHPAAEHPPEPEQEPPRLVIGRLFVDVVPAQPPVREVVRIVSRAASTLRSRPARVASKLRFGLGQM